MRRSWKGGGGSALIFKVGKLCLCISSSPTLFDQNLEIAEILAWKPIVGTNCAPLLVDLFLYSYEADFIQGLLKKNEKKLARSFNFTFHYLDDVLSLKDPGGSIS